MGLTWSANLRAVGIGAAIAVGASLGVLAPAAMAAPANDALAGRTALSGPLPIEVSESNAGATREEGEFISPFGFASGHSVWWEWEAPRSEVVSIGSCGSDFATALGVFTGETLPLRRVAASSGPDCNAQATFAAVAGTRYDIGVDGYSFYIPGSTPAPGEGTIALRIAALPPPPNDDFAAATPVRQIIWESPGGNRTMLGATSGGYNWGATGEPGEPVHAGVGGGASVWYRFIAPGPGTVSISATGNEPDHPVLAVYTGSALSALTPVVSTTQAGRGIGFAAETGQEFRIAVDGLADAEGAPWMGNVDVVVGEVLPPGPGYPDGTAAPPVISKAPAPPRVKGRSINARARYAGFRFVSATRGAGFRCSLDRAPFRVCSSPLRLRHLDPGPHRLGIVSVLRGQPASAPAIVHFALAAPQRRHHRAG